MTNRAALGAETAGQIRAIMENIAAVKGEKYSNVVGMIFNVWQYGVAMAHHAPVESDLLFRIIANFAAGMAAKDDKQLEFFKDVKLLIETLEASNEKLNKS